MLKADRTEFAGGFTRVFHVVPYSTTSTTYADLCDKYGGDNVFRPNIATSENQAFVDAITACQSERNDCIKVYPGTYTFAAAVTVSKAVTIEPAFASGAVVIDCATSAIGGFVLSTAGAVVRGLRFTCSTSSTAVVVSVTSADVVVEGNTFTRETTATTNAYVLASTGDYTKVRNNKFFNTSRSVQVDGVSPEVYENLIIATNVFGGSSCIGIEVTGSAAGKGVNASVHDNTLIVVGTTTNAGIRVANASALNCTIFNNNMHTNWTTRFVTAATTVLLNNLPSYLATSTAYFVTA